MADDYSIGMKNRLVGIHGHQISEKKEIDFRWMKIESMEVPSACGTLISRLDPERKS
jgi:hypothetical protein